MIGVALAFVGVVYGQLAGDSPYLEGRELEAAGKYAEAVLAYEKCAGVGEDLRPYALLRMGHCLAAGGKINSAVRRYEELLEQYPSGPWVPMTRAYMAEALVSAGKREEAAANYERMLDVEPNPWWLHDYGKVAAALFVQLPSYQSKGYAWYRNRVLTSEYIQPRLEAARELLESPQPLDRATAVLGLYRSKAYEEATRAMQDAPSGSSGDPAADELWPLLRLMDATRTLVKAKEWEGAIRHCRSVLEQYAQTREAGELLWWVAEAFEAAGKRSEAAGLFRLIHERCTGHFLGDDALFRVAGIALAEGLKAQAVEILDELADAYPDSRFRSQGQLLSAQIIRETGSGHKAHAYLEQAAAGPLGDFFAHRAVVLLKAEHNQAVQPDLKMDGSRPYLAPMAPAKPEWTPISDDIANDVRLRRMRFFGAHGFEEGEWEAMDLCRTLAEVVDAGPYYLAVAEAGFAHSALEFANAHKWGIQDGKPTVERQRLEWPLAYWPLVKAVATESGVDPYLILAVARQESTFRAGIMSHAGATGVMQLMPATAAWMGDVDPNIDARHVANLKSPTNSLRLGTFYLLRMIERSNANLIFALGSYNGGPGNVDKWRRAYPGNDMDEFIERIPFSETQRYVQRVLGNYAAYYTLYPPPAE